MSKEKKSTKKEELTDEEKEELSELSGENNVKAPKRLNLTNIKLNGSKGFFTRSENKDGEFVQTEINAKELKGVVLKIRRVLTAHKKEKGIDYTLFTNEHNSWRDDIILFEASEGTSKMLMKGSVSEVRERFPELRVKQIFYFLLEPDKEVVKLIIRGKGLSALYEFFNEFSSGEHLFEYNIGIGVQEEEGKLGTYFFNVFEKLEPVDDIKLVQEKIKEVSTSIQQIEDYYKKQEEEISKRQSSGNFETGPSEESKKEKDIPIIEDEIDIDEIPF